MEGICIVAAKNCRFRISGVRGYKAQRASNPAVAAKAATYKSAAHKSAAMVAEWTPVSQTVGRGA
jgi:hypothetical protein